MTATDMMATMLYVIASTMRKSILATEVRSGIVVTFNKYESNTFQ